MPISFPNNPSVGDIYDFGGIHYIYNGDGWVNKSIYGITAGSGINFTNYNGTGPIIISTSGGPGGVGATGATGATGPQGNTGATGPVGDYVISFNGKTGAIQGVSSINGNTGAISNVAFTNANQVFTATQQFTAGISSSDGVTFSGNSGIKLISSIAARYIEIIPGNPNVMQGYGSGGFKFKANIGALDLACSNVTRIGDVDLDNQGTILYVDDDSGIISFAFAGGQYTFPNADGSANQYLKTDGAGQLSWDAAVRTVNGYSGGVTFLAGSNVTLTPGVQGITISATSGGSSQTNSTTQTINFSEFIDHLEFVIAGPGDNSSVSLQGIENVEIIGITFDTVINAGYSGRLNSIKSFYDDTNGWSARLILTPPFIGIGSTAANEIISAGITAVYIEGGFLGSPETWTNITSQSVRHKEGTYTIKTITGQTWVTANSFITCEVMGITTTDHTPEDASVEGVKFDIYNIVAGTGFDIIGHAPEGTYGKYTVKCLGQ